MHSGGSQKEPFSILYIQAPEREARSVFYSRFGHNPERVTCSCCGSDYSVSSDPSASPEEITGFHRNAFYAVPKAKHLDYSQAKYFDRREDIPDDWEIRRDMGEREVLSLEDYFAQDDIAVIYAKEIEEYERHVTVPDELGMWDDDDYY